MHFEDRLIIAAAPRFASLIDHGASADYAAAVSIREATYLLREADQRSRMSGEQARYYDGLAPAQKPHKRAVKSRAEQRGYES